MPPLETISTDRRLSTADLRLSVAGTA